MYSAAFIFTVPEETLIPFTEFTPSEPASIVIETLLERAGFAHLICKALKPDGEVDTGYEQLDAGAGADVEKIEYKKEKNTIILEYKISSDEETFKIEINEEDDINE